MDCKTVNFGNGGYAIICGRRRPRPKRCHYCNRPSGWLCDLPIGLPVGLDPSEQRTCDRPICALHRVNKGPELDWCLEHIEKGATMTSPAESPSWPPEDAGELLNRWRGMGSPEIVLNPGVSIIDLDKWFDPMVFPWPSNEELGLVREQVAGSQPVEEQPRLL